MPELPEVETIRRQLAPVLEGRRIGGGWSFDSPKFTDASRAAGHVVQAVRRRGKYLLVELDPDGATQPDDQQKELVIHLGMTGRLAVGSDPFDGSPGVDHHPHLRGAWSIGDGDWLTFHDARRFGRIAVVPAGEYGALPTLANLGPEPMSAAFTPASLRDGLRGRRALKTALIGQRLVAGVGNIYADEALWQAGVSPLARRLSLPRAVAVHGAIRDVLESALDNGGTTLRDYRNANGSEGTNQHRLQCYGRGGQACRRCNTPLSHRFLDGRGTTWCRVCQS